jgi:hypothetical protein
MVLVSGGSNLTVRNLWLDDCLGPEMPAVCLANVLGAWHRSEGLRRRGRLPCNARWRTLRRPRSPRCCLRCPAGAGGMRPLAGAF